MKTDAVIQTPTKYTCSMNFNQHIQMDDWQSVNTVFLSGNTQGNALGWQGKTEKLSF